MSGVQYPDYVRQVFVEAATAQFEPISKASSHRSNASPVLISVVKNERDLLPPLLDHYRDLGVDLFVMIDNQSTDGSLEYLSAQPDVDAYLVRRKFLWPQKQGWINRAIAMYGYDRWYIYVDADEHIVFDGAGARSFQDLTATMDKRRIRRVRGMLLDMYADGPILESKCDMTRPLWESYPLFDSDSYEEFRYKEIISRKGGPRPRRFRQAGAKTFNPEMSKYPLFRIQAGELMANPHHIYPVEPNFVSDCYLGVLHFKFTSNFANKMTRAIAEKTYWDGSSEYVTYRDALSKDPKLSFVYKGSARYNSPEDIVKRNLITAVGW